MTRKTSPTLYRLYRADGALLYIGMTLDPSARLSKHRQDKPWWTEVATVKLETFATPEELRSSEVAAIAAEQPLYNIKDRNGTKPAEVSVVASENMVDGLLGRWFHTWEELPEGDNGRQRSGLRNGKVVCWQGQIVDRDGDDYLVQCYSWWDGEATSGEQLIRRDDMRDWTFYTSAEKMQMSLGCSESFQEGKCRNPATHRTSLGNYVCWKCAKFYSAATAVA